MSLAHRVRIRLGADRRLELVLPNEFPVGAEAEVIVLSDALQASPREPVSWVDLPVAEGNALPRTARYHREDLYSDEQ
jgi:hypothetical protein